MSAETTARIIQTIIAPTVLITACAIILNGIIGQYNTIGSRLSSLVHERLELLQKNAFKDFLGREWLVLIAIEIRALLNNSMNCPHPQPFSLWDSGAVNSCPLSLWERARVRANLAGLTRIHTLIQQRRNSHFS